jgi:hypothetical protein
LRWSPRSSPPRPAVTGTPACAAAPPPALVLLGETTFRELNAEEAFVARRGDGPKGNRRPYAQNRYGTVTTADFVRLGERRSGRQLHRFFDLWLYRPVKPTTW